MPFVVEQIQSDPIVTTNNEKMDPMSIYTLLFVLMLVVFHRVILFLVFAGLKLTLLGVFGFATYKLFLT